MYKASKKSFEKEKLGKLHFAPPNHSEHPWLKSVTVPGHKKKDRMFGKGVRNDESKKYMVLGIGHVQEIGTSKNRCS